MSWSHSQLEKWDGVTQKHNKPYRFWAFSPRGAEVAGCTCFAVRCRNVGLLSGGCVCSAQSHVAPLQSGCDTVISSEGEQEPKISARSFPQSCFVRASFSLSLQRELSAFIASLCWDIFCETHPYPWKCFVSTWNQTFFHWFMVWFFSINSTFKFQSHMLLLNLGSKRKGWVESVCNCTLSIKHVSKLKLEVYLKSNLHLCL